MDTEKKEKKDLLCVLAAAENQLFSDPWSQSTIFVFQQGSARPVSGESCGTQREGTAVGCLANESPPHTFSLSSRTENQHGSCWGAVIPNYLQLIVWMRITKETMMHLDCSGKLPNMG